MANRIIRHKRIRKKIIGNSDIPRLSVYRSNKHLMAQLIDDANRITICGMSTRNMKFDGTKTDCARLLGEKFAQKILSIENGKYKKIVFDRGGYKYHGRVKAFADALKSNGLIF